MNPDNGVQCRGRLCGVFLRAGEGVPARKVLGTPRARGWYCRSCAHRITRYTGKPKRSTRRVGA